MDLELVVVVAVCIGLVVAAVHVAAPVRTVGGMFRAPELGWPSGVQEDDDLHWSWSTADPRAMRPGRPADADWQELDPATLRLPAQRLLPRRRR